MYIARKRVEADKVESNSTAEIITESPEKPVPATVENIIRGPIDRQIETRTPDGKRRITPKFLLPPDRTMPMLTSSEPR